MNNNFNKVVAEAKGYFIVNMEETFICWNDERGYFYCNGKTLAIIHIRDHEKGLNPEVMGYWNNTIYKCIETGVLYKDGAEYETEPKLYSCGNTFDGELGFPIDPNLEIRFIGVPVRPTKEERFNYQLLDRLRIDCDYYLGNGNRYPKHLWAGNEKEQIEKMKEIYNSFSDDKKPVWLNYEEISKYEKLMIK